MRVPAGDCEPIGGVPGDAEQACEVAGGEHAAGDLQSVNAAQGVGSLREPEQAVPDREHSGLAEGNGPGPPLASDQARTQAPMISPLGDSYSSFAPCPYLPSKRTLPRTRCPAGTSLEFSCGSYPARNVLPSP